MSFLLDTNFCVQYLRGKNALVRQRLAQHSTAEIKLCSVVLSELHVGALHSARPAENRTKIDHFAAPFVSLPFDDAAADEYSRVRFELERRGMTIGPYDLQIAAIALLHGCTLVTNNVGEFSRVQGLAIEDWESP